MDRSVVKRIKVVTLGPKGTFSEVAGDEIRRRVFGTLILQSSWDEVAKYLTEGNADLAVMAYKNSLSGEVPRSINAMKKYGIDYSNPVYKLKIPIKQAIGEHPENKENKVYSFENALMQCSDYLSKIRIPDSKEYRIHVDSTVAAAEKVLKERSGKAIAMLETLIAVGFTRENIIDDIGNKKYDENGIEIRNETEFYVLRK